MKNKAVRRLATALFGSNFAAEPKAPGKSIGMEPQILRRIQGR